MNLFNRNRNRFTDPENKLMVSKGERRGGINYGLGISNIYKEYSKYILYTTVNKKDKQQGSTV